MLINFIMNSVMKHENMGRITSKGAKGTLLKTVSMNFDMCPKQSCPGKRRVTVFPRTSIFFTFTALVTISVQNSLVAFYIHSTISNILTVVNQTGNIFPLMYSFAVFDQTVVIWSSLELASNAFYTSICDRMSWFSETQKSLK